MLNKKKLKSIFKELDNRKELKNFKQIELTNIVIQYPKTNLKIEVPTFTIKKLDKISITGKSSQGKTSVISLILGNISSYNSCRFYS
ncbi:MAG: hypothetical protein HFI86_04925 [Bacilli bacterium]|nr:hypothetical protein [Bacilli bacterium]